MRAISCGAIALSTIPLAFRLSADQSSSDVSGTAQATLVAVYIRGRKSARRLGEIRDATIQAAAEISRRLGAAAHVA
ncbi:MAG: hypothetical protein ABI831_23870 [Betaproteobacteria bacterium]